MRTLFSLALLMCAITPASAKSAAGLQWIAPKAWEVGPAKPMRVTTYVIPAAKEGQEKGELAVFYFGPGQGGAVDANIQRWIGQFQKTGEVAPEKAAKVTKEKVNGLQATKIDLTGTYLASVGPPMAGRIEAKPDYRLLGAIVEGPEGAVFFKLTGPAATVGPAKGAFDKLIKSVKKAPAAAK